jgi:hypothetical protein
MDPAGPARWVHFLFTDRAIELDLSGPDGWIAWAADISGFRFPHEQLDAMRLAMPLFRIAIRHYGIDVFEEIGIVSQPVLHLQKGLD